MADVGLPLRASSEPSKYDRQLRLWGDAGQESFKVAHVICLGSDACASESLKNLILPGVGHVDIVDDALVSSRDLWTNFFVMESDLGTPRAAAVARYMRELNEDVKVEFITCSPEDFLAADFRGLCGPQTLLILANMDLPLCLRILSWRIGKEQMTNETEGFPSVKAVGPVIIAKSRGLIGWVRLFVRGWPVYDSKVSQRPDLQLCRESPKLKDFVNGIDLDSLDDEQHANVPSMVLLMKVLEKFKVAHGRLPIEEDQTSLKSSLEEMRRAPTEENFKEAVRSVGWICYADNGKLSDGTKRVFQHPLCDKDNSHYWKVARGLRDFHRRRGRLPQSGQLPDMTSSSEYFSALRSVFSAMEDEDRVQLSKEADLGDVPAETIRALCKAANSLDVIDITPLSEAAEAASFHEIGGNRKGCNNITDHQWPEHIRSLVLSNPRSNVYVWLAMLAAELYKEQHGNWPTGSDQLPFYGATCRNMMNQLGFQGHETIPHLDEMLKAVTQGGGGNEIHTTSAVVGGVVGQEAAKLLTYRFVPMRSTFVYNGYMGGAFVFDT